MSLGETQPGLRNALYISTRAASGSVHDWHTEIRDILAQSRVFNKWRGLTGALLANSHFFVQVLEGPSEGLTAALGAIVADPRHRIIRLQEGDIPGRAFRHWSMAYVHATEPSIEVLGSMQDFLQGASASGTLTMMKHLLDGAGEDPDGLTG